ncbi:uncharacterized protein LOC124854775 [Hippoglossus stenolepis]|uniref:uncharacterized protein LOC124854775 n=1 Tax=Hippoglossus stenolepis TaxID=195615 RepID=UPI001FAF1314|nr:uncharacterized protein LOC124854775 [Hippoglossus stenolepis]
MAQRFHNWSFQNGLTPHSQVHELVRVTKRWLEPEKSSPADILETLVMDCYLRALPYEAQKITSHQKLTTATELVEAVEQYQTASDMLHPTRKEPIASVPTRPGGPRQKGPKPGYPHYGPPHRIVNQPWQPRGFLNTETCQCSHCGELGHISWQCDKPDEPMHTAESASSPHVHFPALLGETPNAFWSPAEDFRPGERDVWHHKGPCSRGVLHPHSRSAAKPQNGHQCQHYSSQNASPLTQV